MRTRVATLGPDALRWGFDAQPPHVDVPQPRGWSTYTAVDPRPAYAHDAALVESTLAVCERAFPPLSDVIVSLLSFDLVARTNGHAERDHSASEDKACPGGVIVLAGKAIPLHPAMTRYLVAHEYGHHVQWWIEHSRGLEVNDLGTLRAEYAEMRGIKKQPPYGPGTWHLSVGEVLANDFRILVAGVEPEFWPHPTVDRPERSAIVRQWWTRAIEASKPSP